MNTLGATISVRGTNISEVLRGSSVGSSRPRYVPSSYLKRVSKHMLHDLLDPKP